MKIQTIRTVRAAGYGILAALGSSVPGLVQFDLPDVHGVVGHIAAGLGVACLTYAGPRQPRPSG